MYCSLTKQRMLLSSILASVQLFVQGAAEAKTVSGWILQQKHGFNGKQTVYITPDALRVECKDLGYTFIASTASGKATAFSDSKHLRCSVAIDKYVNNMAKINNMFTGSVFLGLTWVKAAEQKEAPANTAYVAEGTESLVKGSRQGGFLSGGKYDVMIHHVILVSHDLALQKNLVRVLSEFQGLPDLGAVPVKITSRFGKDDVRELLTTLDRKRIEIDSTKFDVPLSYKETPRMSEVGTGSDTAGVSEFFAP